MAVKIIDRDLGWKRIKAEVAKMKGSHVNVGVLSESGAYEKGGSASLADVATWMEFGTTTGIPERPFMAQSFDNNLKQIQDFVARRQDEIYAGTKTTQTVLESLGVFFAAKVKGIFVQGEFAPNSPETIKAKGSSRPLIDTGRLRASINHEVIIK